MSKLLESIIKNKFSLRKVNSSENKLRIFYYIIKKNTTIDNYQVLYFEVMKTLTNKSYKYIFANSYKIFLSKKYPNIELEFIDLKKLNHKVKKIKKISINQKNSCQYQNISTSGLISNIYEGHKVNPKPIINLTRE